jgi:hypothetical protein
MSDSHRAPSYFAFSAILLAVGALTSCLGASDPVTGGYWILKSNGGVAAFHAPWRGSVAYKLPAGVSATAIASSPRGGYLILTSDGRVHAFGTRSYSSDAAACQEA